MTTVPSTAAWRTGFGFATATALVLAGGLVKPVFAAEKAPERSQVWPDPGGEDRPDAGKSTPRSPTGFPRATTMMPVLVEITQADRLTPLTTPRQRNACLSASDVVKRIT